MVRIVCNPALYLCPSLRRPEKVDFVRMASLFDAIIVPFASIGKS